MDAAQNIFWQDDKEYDLDFAEEHVEQNKEGSWEAEVPVMSWLDKGKYSVYVCLENVLGGQTIEKLLALKL